MQRSIQTRKLYSKGMPRHSVYGNSIPKLILRRSKPSFQPSIPNILLTSKHKPETEQFSFVWMLHGSTKIVVRAVALLSAKTKWRVANSMEICFLESKTRDGAVLPQIDSFTTGRTPNWVSLLITEGSNAPHKMLPNCACACNKSSSHKSSPDRQTWHMVKTIRNSFKAPELETKTNSLHSLHAPNISNASHITRKLLSSRKPIFLLNCIVDTWGVFTPGCVLVSWFEFSLRFSDRSCDLILWKPRKRITDLFHCRSWAKHPHV